MAVERFINPFLLVIPAPDGINKREVCQVSFFFFFARRIRIRFLDHMPDPIENGNEFGE